MLQDNRGCQLPCWWGFTPGETSWQAAEDFFASYGKRALRYRNPPLTIYTVFFYISGHDLEQINQDYIVDDGMIETISVHAVPPTRNDELVYGDAQFAEDWERYMLPEMLVAYGQPSQVFLGVYKSPWMPFDLLLFYPEKGILAQYSGPTENREWETFRVCPHQVEITLYLWSPNRSMALEDIPGVGGYTYAADEMSALHSLEEATGMSIEQFYQIFSQPDNQTCLETPADLW